MIIVIFNSFVLITNCDLKKQSAADYYALAMFLCAAKLVKLQTLGKKGLCFYCDIPGS